VLQCVALSCRVLQCVAMCFNDVRIYPAQSRCTTLQCTATHCNALQHKLKHASTHTATHYNTLQHCATHCNTHTLRAQSAKSAHTQPTAAHCNTLQHTATHCSTLQQYKTHTWSAQSARSGRYKQPTSDARHVAAVLRAWLTLGVALTTGFVLVSVFPVCCSVLQCVTVR